MRSREDRNVSANRQLRLKWRHASFPCAESILRGQSASSIGRILKRRGMIAKNISEKRRRAALHPRARFPHGMRISSPGDMVQMDTKHIMLPGGKKLYQFPAIDVLSKTRVLRVKISSFHAGTLLLD